MRVLLLGATGNLGHHVVPALLNHHHSVVVFIRSRPKLESLVPASIIDELTIVIGDALDPAAIQRAILDNNCDAVVNTAGNQVAPWKEQVLPKIVQSVVDAAVAVGKQRGKPMRAWVIGGMNSLGYPGTAYLIDDYFPQFITAHHRGTINAIGSIPVSELEWSVVCVAMLKMFPKTADEAITFRPHQLLVAAEAVPGWEDSWLRSIPVVGDYVNLFYGISKHTTFYMDVADFMAADLESGDRTFIGKKVGIKQKQKAE